MSSSLSHPSDAKGEYVAVTVLSDTYRNSMLQWSEARTYAVECPVQLARESKTVVGTPASINLVFYRDRDSLRYVTKDFQVTITDSI